MQSGLYKVEKIEGALALLMSLEDKKQTYTFPLSDFTHKPTKGDVVEVWLDGDAWKTKYREKETGSVKSHALDFLKRMTDKE